MINIRLLPHPFKIVGLVLFLIFGFPSWSVVFIEGLSAGRGIANTYETVFPDLFFSNTFTLISYFGLFIYAISKDRVYDELTEKIRSETLQIIFFGTLVVILFGLLINGDWEMSASYLFEAQVIFFLIINKTRKMILKYQL